MQDKDAKDKDQAAKPVRDDNAACELCGAFGAFHVGDKTLCQDCYVGAGSCCPEFGKDDLWAAREQTD